MWLLKRFVKDYPMRTLNFELLFFDGKTKMLTDDKQQVMATAHLEYNSS